MREGLIIYPGLILQLSVLLFFCFSKSKCDSLVNTKAMAPYISPSENPEPFIPVLGPSPMIPLTNDSIPALSGLCTLNFLAVESLLSTTATDCWASFAPYLANVVCCPQFSATLVTLVGQSSRYSGMLALNLTHSKHCLSDVEKILTSRAANPKLQKICSIQPANLTSGSCPVVGIDAFESIVETTRLFSACQKIDNVNECCDQVCQNAISHAAQKIALNGKSASSVAHELSQHLTRIEDCKNVVLRWLAGKLDPLPANSVLRGLSNCKVNKDCPLAFPNMTNVVKDCAHVIRNQTGCCEAMESYVSKLQEQSFITNVQALHCAVTLGTELQKAKVSNNVYNLCHVNIKDFSLQVGSQESGCLLPSLPTDATYDTTSGIGFTCDLNDNIVAPWPSSSSKPVPFCNRTTKIPALPKATSAQQGFYIKGLKLPLIFSSLAVIKILI